MHAGGRERQRIVIVGGGVAAVEALLALGALCPHLTRVTLISPARELLERPVTVGEAFGRATAQAYDLADVVGTVPGARLIRDTAAEVRAAEHTVVTASGARVAYDKLVIAIGAIPRPALTGALTFRGRSDVSSLRRLLDELSEKPGRSVALVLPSERMWPLPIYELALMTAAHLHEAGARRSRCDDRHARGGAAGAVRRDRGAARSRSGWPPSGSPCAPHRWSEPSRAGRWSWPARRAATPTG